MQRDREETVTKNPLSIIYRHIGAEITVMLKSGERYRGILSKVDNYMNLLIEDAVEESGNKATRFGTILIRGNNILFIKLEKI